MIDMAHLTWYDVLSFILLSTNIMGTFFVSYKCRKYRCFDIEGRTLLIARLLIHGIALVEVLFLISLHAWIAEDMGASIGYLSSFSSKMYTLGEITKSIFFLTILIFTSQWLTIRKQRYGDHIHG